MSAALKEKEQLGSHAEQHDKVSVLIPTRVERGRLDTSPKLGEEGSALHGPISTLSNASINSRFRAGSEISFLTPNSAPKAAEAMAIARNVQELLPQGTAPIASRFQQLLERV